MKEGKTMQQNITILLTGAGAPGAPGIIRCYRNVKERNIRIIGVDMNQNAAGKVLVDKFYVAPKASSSDFIPKILEICEKEKVDVVVPIVTKELEKFAKHKEEFEGKGVKVSVLDYEQLAIVNDKGKLLDAIAENGLPTPRYEMVDTPEQMFEAVYRMGNPESPVCVKVTDGNGSRGVRMVDLPENDYERFFNQKPDSSFISYDYLKKIFTDKQIPKMMVMEFLPGDEYSVDVLADEKGIRAMLCRRGTRVVSSIQVECVVERNEKVEKLCTDVVDALKLVGQFGFDIKCNAKGEPSIIEINPRLTAGIVACAAAGCNLPYMELLRTLGEELPKYDVKYGTVMTRRWKEEFIAPNGSSIEW